MERVACENVVRKDVLPAVRQLGGPRAILKNQKGLAI